jgi:hypothetical protein
MLNIFTLANGRLFQEEIESLEELSVPADLGGSESPRWKKNAGSSSTTVVNPRRRDGRGHRGVRAFYEEDNGEPHIRPDFLVADEDDPRTVRVAFILNLVNDDPARACCFPSTTRTCRCFACAADAGALSAGVDRRQGSAAQAVRRRCRVPADTLRAFMWT